MNISEIDVFENFLKTNNVSVIDHPGRSEKQTVM